MLKLKEITCKNALVKSRISGVDYCLNPYVGCQHNCAYCYDIFMKGLLNSPRMYVEVSKVMIK